MFAEDQDVVQILIGDSKKVTQLPTQRRNAIQFRYGDIDPEHSMSAIGAFAAPTRDQKVPSTIRRDAQNTPCDSWEIDVCVGFAVQNIMAPNWAAMKQLGRSLAIFKVHKEPKVCELFFMPREEVIKTYKDVLPKNLEWVHLYEPETECAFWAELYRPSDKKSRGGGAGGARSSFLTDELCGGFGSRHCMASHLMDMLEAEPTEKLKNKIRVLTSDCTRAECEELTAQAQMKIDKNRRRKDRQKEKKKEEKAEAAEEEKKVQAEIEQLEAASYKAQRMPAPHLAGMDFAAMMAKPE